MCSRRTCGTCPTIVHGTSPRCLPGVSLELEFTAAGNVRVLRVVRGLGHGLDEAAERAALRMRFKPAQSDGRPVDSRATVHITFRLS